MWWTNAAAADSTKTLPNMLVWSSRQITTAHLTSCVKPEGAFDGGVPCTMLNLPNRAAFMLIACKVPSFKICKEGVIKIWVKKISVDLFGNVHHSQSVGRTLGRKHYRDFLQTLSLTERKDCPELKNLCGLVDMSENRSAVGSAGQMHTQIHIRTHLLSPRSLSFSLSLTHSYNENIMC